MANQIDRAALSGKWVHSHEEDQGDKMVFRPASYNFPRSRGRRSFELAPDGRAVEHAIGPDDRPDASDGSWQLKDTDELELTTGGSNARKTVMKVLSAASDKLVVKKGQ